ncbi:MAG: type II secretion system secretin GspD [Pseudomonadota bacterium]
MLQKIPVALAMLLLVSCTTMETEPPPATESSDTATDEAAAAEGEVTLAQTASELAQQTTEKGRAQPIIYKGNDQSVRVPPRSAPVTFRGKDVSLNFEQAPLEEVMHAIMGDILNLDYVVDQPVTGKVTLRTRTPIPRDQLLAVLESLLAANNALLVRGDDGRYLVTGSGGDGQLPPGVSNPDDLQAGYSTIVVPLRFISASDMSDILAPLAGESAFVRVDNTRNILMLAGTRAQLNGWLDIVNTFDVDQLKGMSVGLFPLENSDVQEVAEALGTMLDNGEEGNLVRVIPVSRLNSILLVTPRAHYLDTLGTWIERLDSAPDSRFEKRLYVYAVQNTSASRLAILLNSIYADELSGSDAGESDAVAVQGPGTISEETVAPGLTPESLNAGVQGSLVSRQQSSGGGTMQAIGSSQRKVGTAALSDVRVVADEDNNALMIYATGKQYDIIKAALVQLDIVATQVIIEASILEVTLTDDLRYGVEWTFDNDLNGGYTGEGILAGVTGSPAALFPGFSYAIANGSGEIKAVLNALAEESLLNVISTPSVMVLDNHTATIQVGDQVPIIAEQSTSDASDTSRITQSVVYRDTGVLLEVTPSVNAGGLVTMDILQSVTDVGNIDAATGQRVFLERAITSRVAVRSTESVVLGGLIRENARQTEDGVPFLHTMPIIGPLFGTTQTENDRTELLVIITPRALYNEQQLRQVSEEMRSQIRHMELLENPF